MSVSRRDLAKSLLIATVAAAVDGQETAKPNPEVEAKVAWILGRYGDRFTEQQKKEIRDRIAGNQAGLEAMRAYPIENDVEPATLFRVHRAKARPSKVVPHT
jgi:hypothetical protein